MKRIGVLALQGGVVEHFKKLEQLENVLPVSLKYKEDLANLDGFIIPGGESTTLSKLLHEFGLFLPLKEKIKEGLPVWGTCAGMILLAKGIENDELKHLQVMDIIVKRNAYGRQLGSFQTDVTIPTIQKTPIPVVFIRAPFASKVGPDVEVLLELDRHIVACRQKNMLATSFHPELTNSTAFHKYFIGKMC